MKRYNERSAFDHDEHPDGLIVYYEEVLPLIEALRRIADPWDVLHTYSCAKSVAVDALYKAGIPLKEESQKNDDDVMEDIPTPRQPEKGVKATLTTTRDTDRLIEAIALLAESVEYSRGVITSRSMKIRALKGGGK
jgi:hypothetical protein